MKWSLMITFLILAACGATAMPTDTPVPVPPADPDALTLVAMGEEAIGLARQTIPDAVLRQVDVSPDGGAISFRFTDEAATRTIVVHVPGLDVPMHGWRVQDEEFTRFSGQPKGLDLRAVHSGPAAVARSATGHWPGCTVRAMTLFGEEEDLSWIVFCNLPEGVVSGWVDVRTGAFTPSSAPPAVLPPIATLVFQPEITEGWKEVKAPGYPSQPGFALKLPEGWELRELQGIDSYVGEIVGDGVRLLFDYGSYSWNLNPDDDLEHEYNVTHEEIGEVEAKLIWPKASSEEFTGGKTSVEAVRPFVPAGTVRLMPVIHLGSP